MLVVEDEENISFLVSSALRRTGLQVEVVANGADAVSLASSFNPEVILLDVRLPDLDGFEVLKRIRAAGNQASVLFMTARGATADRVRGLTAGGDDYIVKPFAVEELIARVQVALRRRGTLTAAARYQVADLLLDVDAHRVWRADREVALSATEFRLLECLLAHAGRAVSRRVILDQVWAYDFGGETAIIESFVSNLRRKVDDGRPRLIHTVRGVGYAIREPS